MPPYVHIVCGKNDSNAILAAFIFVYDSPCSCRLTRKSSTEFKGGLCELTSRLEQKSCHFLI